ncbi:nucleotidyltransferase domain-containing protein [Marispirochaeta aestuarii]|nr:nucleotidyltransferase domain-containing protein [Marispirochaeta aestuarii]
MMNAMLEYEKYIDQITGALMQVDPYKIILFGSAATGNLHNDSDIDIIVVLDNETIPKKEYELILSNKSSFFWDINTKSRIIYEKAC